MNAELSRRVARLMHTPPILALDLPARRSFLAAVEGVNSFEELPPLYRGLIRDSERYVAQRR